MALKDLPGSTVLNFKILLDQLNNYINAKFKQKAGNPPTGRSREEKGGKPWLYINQGKPPFAQSLMLSLYDSLKSEIKVQPSDLETFNRTFTDTATWENNFFIIRTQVVGVVAGGDPILKQFDDLWTKLTGIRAEWRFGK